MWINDIYLLGNATGIQGYENTVVVDVANNIVYKINKFIQRAFSDIQPAWSTSVSQSLVPWKQIRFGRFTGIDHGHQRTPYIELVIKQDLVKNATQASIEDSRNFMMSLDFVPLSESKIFKWWVYSIRLTSPECIKRREWNYLCCWWYRNQKIAMVWGNE